MRNVYTTLLLIFAAAILACSYVIGRRDKSPLTKSIRRIMTAAPLTMAAYAAALLGTSEMFSELAYAVYYAVSDILLVCMLLYALKYTGIYEPKRFQKIIAAVFIAADCVLLLLNGFMDRVLIFSCELMDDGSGTLFYGIAERGALYNFHRLVIYGLAALSVAVLVSKCAKSPKMYRKKYGLTLMSLMIIIAANIIYLMMGLEIDFSVLAYGIMAVAIYYFNVVYVPQGLMNGLLSSSIKSIDDGVICFDIDGNCVYANSVAHSHFRTEETAPFVEYYNDFMKGRSISEVEDCGWKKTREMGSALHHYDIQFKILSDAAGTCVGCFFKIHDETEEVKKLEAERFRATHDRLTGIYNREYFYDTVTERVRAAEENTYCMVCSDIKNFKLINDIFGIDEGDEILISIADTLRKLSCPGAVYARLSGDRFAICLPQESYDEKTFIDAFHKANEKEGSANCRVYVHIGVYNIIDKNIDVSVMCDRAYMAIKTIKASFTDTIAYYDDEIRQTSISEQKVTGEFEEALAEGQFCIYIQPQISANGDVLGGEALVRWLHPQNGLIPPGAFIGILERTGLICRLDMHTWELACRKLREWKDRGLDGYHISVNISPKDFYFTDIYETFTHLVEKYGIDPHALRLEVTETAIMSDFNKQYALIQRLREYGFLVEIDDFGSGYSSLNVLKDMIVDTLKIDMCFLRETEQRDRSKTILRTIISMSKELGMEVITEGVETKAHVDFLTDMGCDVFQGYYFARPMPVSEFEEKYLKITA